MEPAAAQIRASAWRDQVAGRVRVQLGGGLVEELVDLVGADPGVVLLDGQRAVGAGTGLAKIGRASVAG